MCAVNGFHLIIFSSFMSMLQSVLKQCHMTTFNLCEIFEYTHLTTLIMQVCAYQWRIYKFKKGGLATGAQSTLANLVLPHPLSITLAVQTEYLKATLGLIKCLEISKELIHVCECVTMPGCCCCMPLLHLMDSWGMYTKIHYSPPSGVHLHSPYPPSPPESATAYTVQSHQ